PRDRRHTERNTQPESTQDPESLRLHEGTSCRTQSAAKRVPPYGGGATAKGGGAPRPGRRKGCGPVGRGGEGGGGGATAAVGSKTSSSKDAWPGPAVARPTWPDDGCGSVEVRRSLPFQRAVIDAPAAVTDNVLHSRSITAFAVASAVSFPPRHDDRRASPFAPFTRSRRKSFSPAARRTSPDRPIPRRNPTEMSPSASE